MNIDIFKKKQKNNKFTKIKMTVDNIKIKRKHESINKKTKRLY